MLRPAPFRDPKTSPRGRSPSEHPSSNCSSILAQGICAGCSSAVHFDELCREEAISGGSDPGYNPLQSPDLPAIPQLPPWAPAWPCSLGLAWLDAAKTIMG